MLYRPRTCSFNVALLWAYMCKRHRRRTFMPDANNTTACCHAMHRIETCNGFASGSGRRWILIEGKGPKLILNNYSDNSSVFDPCQSWSERCCILTSGFKSSWRFKVSVQNKVSFKQPKSARPNPTRAELCRFRLLDTRVSPSPVLTPDVARI
jgi:hypothetical protein